MALHIKTQAPSTPPDIEVDRQERLSVKPQISLRGPYEDRLSVCDPIGRLMGILNCIINLPVHGFIEVTVTPGTVATEGKVTLYGTAEDERLLALTIDRAERVAQVIAHEYGEVLADAVVLRFEYTCTFL